VIPKIDSDIGISVYSTSFSGCGGKIRVHKDDFLVSEKISQKTLNQISEKDGYVVYKLKKQNIDTRHAINNIFKKTGLRLKSLGLKDASAVTEQYVCSMNKSPKVTNLNEQKYSLEKIGFTKKPLSKKDMIGNHFTINVTDSSENICQFNEYDKILNFYGYQRFGSKRAVTHLLGKSILQQDFENAVNLLLSFTSEYDTKENTELRQKLSDISNFKKIRNEIPKQMDLELIVVDEIIQHNDPKKAIRALPTPMKRFFVQAYQSFLFNKTLSMAFENGENLFEPDDGDVCFDKDSKLGKYSNDEGQRLAIPIAGYSYYKKTRFDYYISKILEEEEITHKDFFIKNMQEASNEGGFRNASIKCDDYSFSGNTVEFTLSRGSFATIVMREVMKPNEPMLSGF